jgi:hypothetical protein
MRSELSVRGVLLAVLCAGPALAQPLVGPSVGSAEALVAEGNRLYNTRQYEEAAATFLRATRADPAQLQAYLGLARARLGAQKVPESCLAYRAYVRVAPSSTERDKAQREKDLCERRLKSLRKRDLPLDPTARSVELKAAFFSALEKQRLVGEGSASELLRALVANDYLAPDLADLAGRLHTAARTAVESLHARALARQEVPAEALRQAPALYTLARDTGEPLPQEKAQAPFLEGVAALRAGEAERAQALLAEAAAADPSRTEYRLLRAAALHGQGNLAGALQVLEQDLPGDSRTATLRAEVALGDSPEAGASTLESLLFQRYFPPGR